jgi:hypothetical protein
MNKHNQEIPTHIAPTKEEREAECNTRKARWAEFVALKELRKHHNKLIYLYLGWHRVKERRWNDYTWRSPCDLKAFFESKLPNHFNDLNTVYTTWTLTIQGNSELEDRYMIELLREVGAEKPEVDGGISADWILASNATAEQRTEALGRTLNIW